MIGIFFFVFGHFHIVVHPNFIWLDNRQRGAKRTSNNVNFTEIKHRMCVQPIITGYVILITYPVT